MEFLSQILLLIKVGSEHAHQAEDVGNHFVALTSNKL